MPNPKVYHTSSEDTDVTTPSKCQRAYEWDLLRWVTFFLVLLVYVQLYLGLAWRRRLAGSDSVPETSTQDPPDPETRGISVNDGLATKLD